MLEIIPGNVVVLFGDEVHFRSSCYITKQNIGITIVNFTKNSIHCASAEDSDRTEGQHTERNHRNPAGPINNSVEDLANSFE